MSPVKKPVVERSVSGVDRDGLVQTVARLQISPDDLLAGARITHEVVVPEDIVLPGKQGQKSASENEQYRVVLRPLTIGAFQLIMKAARDDAGLIPLLMIKEALVEPAFSLEQVRQLHLGLVNFLLAHIREISGLTQKKSQ